MCTNLFNDSRTFLFLQEIDKDTEILAGKSLCRYCGDVLHRSFYERKPRAPGVELPADFGVRPSYCCRRDGCRRRMTPALTRFLGRRVYVSIVVLLVAAMTQGPSAKRLSVLRSELGITAQTIRRWCHYWKRIFTEQSSWRYQRGNFMPPIDEESLPLALLMHSGFGESVDMSSVLLLLRLAIN